MSVQLALRNIRKSFSGKQGSVDVLGGLSFDINERDFVSIIGPSGCGKTTALCILAGLVLGNLAPGLFGALAALVAAAVADEDDAVAVGVEELQDPLPAAALSGPAHAADLGFGAEAMAVTCPAISSMALLLDHLGRSEDAERIEKAVHADIVNRGQAKRSTTEVGDAIAAALA